MSLFVFITCNTICILNYFIHTLYDPPGGIPPQRRDIVEKSMFPYPVPDTMSDDCLYLNVWSPTLHTAAKLPVMVWIYGGSFQNGNVLIFYYTGYRLIFFI